MKNGKLNGKVAVVTGASKGIGAGIAKEFAAEGASVVVNYASAKQDADRVVDEISKRGGKAIAIQGSVAKKAEVEQLFAEAEKAFGKIDILVNNAGVYEFVPLEEVSEQQFHRMFDTNVLGMLLATQEALKHFNSEGGSIINIGSLASSLTPPTAVVYNATKGAVDAITRTLAKELGPRKIRVNSINPGMVVTEGAVAGGYTEGDMRKMFESHDAARPRRTNGRYCARCGLLRFRRFQMDHWRNAPYRGRPSLGYLPPQHLDCERDLKRLRSDKTGLTPQQVQARQWFDIALEIVASTLDHDLFAFAYGMQIDRNRTSAYAVLSTTLRQIGDACAGNHCLSGNATGINTDISQLAVLDLRYLAVRLRELSREESVDPDWYQ